MDREYFTGWAKQGFNQGPGVSVLNVFCKTSLEKEVKAEGCGSCWHMDAV